MPRATDPQTTRRRRKRTPPAPPKQRGHASEGGRTIRPRNRRPIPSPVPAVPPNVFGPKPFERDQAKARKKVERAQRRLPERALPAIPDVHGGLSNRQRAAANRLILRAVRRQAGAKDVRSITRIYDELMQDPRSRRRLAPINRAAAAANARRYAGLARAAGLQGYYPNLVAAGHGLSLQDTVRGIDRRSRVGFGPATVTLNLPAIRSAIGAVTSLEGASPENQFLRNAGRDLVNLGTAPFVGGYEALAGGYEAATRGDTSRLERLGKGLYEGTKQTVTHPAESFREAPITTALTFTGIGSALGRTAGAVARGAGKAEAGGVRGFLAEEGSTVRPPIALTDDAAGPLLERSYSKDLSRKAAQRAKDSRREVLTDREGKPVMVEQRGKKVPVLKASRAEQDRHLRAQADFGASHANAVERMVREEARKEFKVRGIRGDNAKGLVTLAVRGTLRSADTFVEDALAARSRILDEIKARTRDEPGYRHSGELEQAIRNVKLLDKVIQDKRVQAQAPKIMAEAQRIGRRLNERERELLKAGVLSDATRAGRARLIDFAVEHLGARHVTEGEHRAMERAAANVERVAQQKYERALKKANGRRTPEVIAARSAWQSARRERISVSGRDPKGVHAHEQARDAAEKAKGVETAAKRRLEATQRARDKLTGAQASRRGRRAHEGQERTATAAERARLAKARRAVDQAKRELREATSARRKAQEDARRAKLPPTREALRRADGTFLATGDIEAAIKSAGRDPETVAYLPYEGLGRSAFHAQHRPGTRPVMDKAGTRTGEQYRKGAVETSHDLLVEQGVKQATQLAKAQQLDRLVETSGIRHPDGEKLWTWREAQDLSERIDVDTRTGTPVFQMRNGQRLVPMRAYASRLSPETQRIIREDLQGPGAMETLHMRLLNDRILHPEEVKGKGARNVVLVPAAEVERLEQHLRPAGEITKFFQLLNRPFRMAVLPQPRWLTGNIVEPYVVRLTAAGSGLNVFGLGLDLRAAHKAIRSMERSGDPKVRAAAAEIRASQFGGLFVGGGMARTVRRGLEDFPRAERAYGNLVAKLPAVEQSTEMMALAARTVLAPLHLFFRANRTIERGAQKAAFGRQFRKDLQEFTGSWTQTLRLQEKAVAEAARGLTNTATQKRFMRAQQDLLGKYEGYSPRMRAWIQGPTPFLPWALNAARFVYWTMPVHHTALTAALVKTNDVVAKDWKDRHEMTPPGSLRLAVPNGKGGWIDLARYTPYGLFAEGNPLQSFSEQVAPHFHGALNAVGGKDPFGRDLQLDPTENAGNKEPSTGQNIGIAANSLAEALIPYLSTARRLRERGGTPYAGSTVFDPDVKPGTDQQMSAARRTFDPFRPTYLQTPSTASPAPASAAGRDPQEELYDRIAAAQEQNVPDVDEELYDRLARALNP